LTYEGLVNGEESIASATATTAATANSHVGTYAIAVNATSGNYEITPVNGTLTIGKAPLTITADNQSRKYGDTNPAFTLSYEGLVNGEESVAGATASTTATSASHVGDYDIVVNATSS